MVREAKIWRAKAKEWRRLARLENNQTLAEPLLYLADEAERVAAAIEAKALPPLAYC